MLMPDEIKACIEAILFLRSERVGLDELVELLEVPLLDLKVILDEMIVEYNEISRGIQIVAVDGGYLMCTRPEYAGILARADKPVRKRLSSSALETLAIIAYRQPVTRAEIEKIRGVKSDKMIYSLLEKELIAEAGYKESAGKPVLYATTDEFLRLFGLVSLSELPVLEGDAEINDGKVT
jgi:segregation and condensation protein B